MFGGVSRQRTPDGGDIDLALLHCLHQARRGIGLTIIAVDHVAANVVDHPLLPERMGGRGVVSIAADQVHADSELPKCRIVDSPELKISASQSHEYIT